MVITDELVGFWRVHSLPGSERAEAPRSSVAISGRQCPNESLALAAGCMAASTVQLADLQQLLLSGLLPKDLSKLGAKRPCDCMLLKSF